MRKLTIGICAAAVAAAALAVAVVPAGARSRTIGVKIGDDFYIRAGGVHTIRIHGGDRVRWRWAGFDPHSVTTIRGPQRFNSGIRSHGATYTHRFTRRGTYLIQCLVHGPLMRMRVVVR